MKNKAKRWIGTLLAACLVMAMLPAAAFAADTGKAIQLVSDGSAGNIGGGQADNVYFGNYYQSDDSTKEPIKWRVLDDKTNTGNEGLFLLSDVLLGSGPRGDVYFDNFGYKSGAWHGSDAQTWCQDFYSSNFSTGEQSAVICK